MKYRIGLENNLEGRSMAWVLGHPGCFAYGADGETAMLATDNALRTYVTWIEDHGGESPLELEQLEILLEETWDVYDIDQDYNRAAEGYSVNAWFLDDWKPLREEEVRWGLTLLAWSREDLMGVIRGLSKVKLQATYPGERWSIGGILGHVGGAEWWYLDRLGLAQPRQSVPDEPFERLEHMRRRMVEVLPTLIGMERVAGIDGEFWSPRKLLRRAVWHERDHTGHIHKLISTR